MRLQNHMTLKRTNLLKQPNSYLTQSSFKRAVRRLLRIDRSRKDFEVSTLRVCLEFPPYGPERFRCFRGSWTHLWDAKKRTAVNSQHSHDSWYNQKEDHPHRSRQHDRIASDLNVSRNFIQLVVKNESKLKNYLLCRCRLLSDQSE